MKKVRIIIPAYNEEKRIGKTLESYCSFFKKARKEGVNAEMFIVINNTKDKTAEVVKSYMRRFDNLKFIDLKQKGKGLAILSGFKDSINDSRNFELIGFVDADLATPPESFYELIKNIQDYDGVIASRWMKGSIVNHKDSFIRKIYSWGFNKTVRVILGLNYLDTQCGAKLFKKEALKKILPNLSITQWAFDIDLLYSMKKSNLKVKEIPTIWYDIAGSKVKTSTAFQMLLAVLRLRLLNSPFKFTVRLYDRLPRYLKIHELVKTS